MNYNKMMIYYPMYVGSYYLHINKGWYFFK